MTCSITWKITYHDGAGDRGAASADVTIAHKFGVGYKVRIRVPANSCLDNALWKSYNVGSRELFCEVSFSDGESRWTFPALAFSSVTYCSGIATYEAYMTKQASHQTVL